MRICVSVCELKKSQPYSVYYTPDLTMALADILLIIWEVASTILTISWTYFVVLLEAMHQIYISHNGGATADTEDTKDE